MKKSKLSIFLTVILVLTFLSGCLPGGGSSSLIPDRKVPVSQEAANRFAAKIKAANESMANSGTFKLDVTESELTSYLRFKLNNEYHLPVKDPTVWISKGRFIIAGEISSDQLPAKGNGVLAVEPILENGKVHVKIVAIQIGKIKIPSSLFGAISDEANQDLDQIQQNFTVQKFDMQEGELVIIAKSK